MKALALVIPLITLAFGLYLKYRFHIQFALLVRKAWKWWTRRNRRQQ